MAVGDESLRIARELRRTVNTAVDQETRALVRAWARAWDEIAFEFDAAATDILNLDGPPALGQVRRLERARMALEAAQERIVRLIDQSAVRATTAAAEIAAATSQADARQIASQLPRTLGRTAELAVRFDRVNPQALDAIVERTTQQITSHAWPLAAEAAEQMLRALVRAVPQGLSPRTAARQMVGAVQGRFEGGLARAMTIARTELLDVHRQAAYLAQQANSDVLAGWVWLAQLDGRTCPSCVAQHGSLHPLDEPGPEDHQNGRCARMPKTKTWSQLGLAGREPADLITPGPDWFAAQPETTQRGILGPGRFDAWQSGRITFDDLSTRRRTVGWRDSYVATPLSDLVPS